jgi:hypothetical protein
MNRTLLSSLAEKIGHIAPPGCVSCFVEHPNPLYRKRDCVEIGFVLEHRFAFNYWIKSKQNLMYDVRTRIRIADDDFQPPDLVTWDWHNDCGDDCKALEDKLLKLDQANEQEVAFFCWAGLSHLNDGQILPAMWLNALGNVYVIQKQMQDCQSQSRTIRDRYGREHDLHFFRTLKDFATNFERTRSNTGVIWDVDLDYFTKGRGPSEQSYKPALSGEEVTSMLSPTTPWMPLILRDLKGLTIAIEPEFTGGLSRSLELYRYWESALFSAPLFSKKCRWRKGLLKRQRSP